MSFQCKPPRQVIVVLDQNAGTLREDEDTLHGFDLSPKVSDTCQMAQSRGVKLTFVVPRRGQANTEAMRRHRGLGADVHILDTGFDFAHSAALGKAAPDSALVAADRRLRGTARSVGMLTLPNLALLSLAMKGEIPRAARLHGPRDTLLRWTRSSGSVPMHFQPAPESEWAWIGMVSADALAKATLAGFRVSVLPYDVTTHDLFWIRIDDDHDDTRAALARRDILYSEPGQALIALGPDESPDAFGLHGEHGHAEMLSPALDLMEPAPQGLEWVRGIDPSRLDLRMLEHVKKIDPGIPIRWLLPSCATVTQLYQSDLDRYTTAAVLDASGPIVSRHIAHPDNERAETQLLADLSAMGYCPFRHDFQHAGQTHSNIIADLPGTGRYLIKPALVDKWRHILRTAETTDLGQYRAEFANSVKADGLKLEEIADLPDSQLQAQIERILHLHPWFPWWRLKCPLPGLGAGIVVVGCHMDSTAGFDAGYNPATDPAPGRDDDGSGLAGVLSIARHMASLRGKLTHTVRFCFFNAEEAGLVGSKAYAALLKSHNAPVITAICMDMIGYNSDSQRHWEIHAGYSDPAIRDLSVPFAQQIAAAAQAYGVLPAGQIYQGTSSSTGAPDRSLYDGAINRSDHAAFHQQGWPAVVVSEDFFANLASETSADANVNYHRASDTMVDVAYARDIVCAVTRAVTLLAS